MKEISDDFRENDRAEKSAKKAKKEWLVSKSTRFEGYKVDDLFHTIYENSRSAEEASLIEESIVDASMTIFELQLSADKRELERYNLMNESLAHYSLKVNPKTWMLEELKANLNLRPLVLTTKMDYDMGKTYRKLRKEINFLDTDVIDKSLVNSEKVISSPELQPVFFRATLKSNKEDDTVVFISKQISEFIAQIKDYFISNNRKSQYLSLCLKQIFSDMKEKSKRLDSGEKVQYSYEDLIDTFNKLRGLSFKKLQDSYDKMFVLATGKKSDKVLFKDDKFVLDESKFPQTILALKGNNFSAYTNYTDDKFFCKMLGVVGIA